MFWNLKQDMPVVYIIDPEQNLIRTRCIGDVKLPEVLDHFRTLQLDPDCPNWLDVLLDVSEITSPPFTGEIHAVAQEISRTKSKVQFKICAVIAPSDAMYGMMRMFSVLAEPYFCAVRVFRTGPAAEEWLSSQRLLRLGTVSTSPASHS